MTETQQHSDSIGKWQPLIYFILIGNCILRLDPIPILDKIFSLSRFICFGVVCWQFIRNHNKWRLFPFLMMIYWGVEMYSTILHSGRIIPLISYGITILSIFLVLQQDITINKEETLRALARIFSIFIYANFVLLLLFPNGFWNVKSGTSYFILGGNYNQMGGTLIVGICTAMVYQHISNKKNYNLWLLIIISFITLIIVGSKTSIVGLSVLSIFYIVPSEKLKHIGLVAFIAFYFVFQHFTVFNLFEFNENGAMGTFVEKYLKKDMTFSNRTDIWEHSMITIASSPIIGYGLQDDEWNQDNIHAIMAHNFVLALLLKGGIVLLCIFIIIFTIYCIQNLKNKSPANFYSLCGCWILAFMMIMEVYNIGLLCYMLCLLSMSEKLNFNSND